MRILAITAGLCIMLLSSACNYHQPPPPKADVADAPVDAPDPQVNAARHLSPAEVVALEANAAKDPRDVESRATLLVYYGTGNHPAESRRLMLWMIRTHPEGISFHDVKQFTPMIDSALDPEGYQEGKRLWLSQLVRSHVSVPELRNAARYFKLIDPTISQKLLLRAETEDNAEKELGSGYYAHLADGPAWKFEQPLNSRRGR